MKAENFNVVLPVGYAGEPISVVIREDNAKRVFQPSTTNNSVLFTSLIEFVREKNIPKNPSENTGVVSYNKLPGKEMIKLNTMPQGETEGAAPIILDARLIINPDLEQFKINQEYYFSQKELMIFCRKYAHCFANVNDAKELLKSLQNFEVKYEQTVAKSDDRQGNTRDLVEDAIKFSKGEVPLRWKLKMPLYQGLPAVEFEVELEIQKVERNLPGFGFFSTESELMIRETAASQIEKTISVLREYYVCLEVQ